MFASTRGGSGHGADRSHARPGQRGRRTERLRAVYLRAGRRIARALGPPDRDDAPRRRREAILPAPRARWTGSAALDWLAIRAVPRLSALAAGRHLPAGGWATEAWWRSPRAADRTPRARRPVEPAGRAACVRRCDHRSGGARRRPGRHDPVLGPTARACARHPRPGRLERLRARRAGRARASRSASPARARTAAKLVRRSASRRRRRAGLTHRFPAPRGRRRRTRCPACRAARERALRGARRGGRRRPAGSSRRSTVAATRTALLALPGIGPWTVEYVAMRALRDPDAWPGGDLWLRRRGGGRRRRTRWRPWRAYAAMVLWQT